MTTLETIQRQLSHAACPICRKQDFSVRIKSENPDGENVYTAVCVGCRYSFPVSSENNLYRLSNPDIVSWLNEIVCPKCRKRGAEMDFRCTFTVRDSRIFLHCKSCRFEFNESMAAEAYE
jgi:transcription elongation factor Elf1